MANSVNTNIQVDDSGGTLRDISPYVTRFEWPRSVDALETHGVSDTSKEFTAGIKDGNQINIDLIWDNTATVGVVAVFGSDAIGDTRTVQFGPNGTTGGEEQISAEAIVQSISRSHGRNENVAVSVVMQVTGAVTEGTF